MFLWRLSRPLRTNTKKDVLFTIGDWNAKVRSEETPEVRGKFGLGKSQQFCQENTLVRANSLFQQHKRPLYTWTSPDGQYWNQIDYILQPEKEKLYLVSKTRPGANCGSYHEDLIAKLRLKLKKVGETTRPFRYDLNQIPCYYTVELMNKFKGLDLVDRVPEELWMEICNIVQEVVTKTIPKKKKCKKARWLSGKREKGKDTTYPTECRVPENSKER